MRADIAILCLGAMTITLDILVQTFHPGITSNIDRNVIATGTIFAAVLLFIARKIPALTSLFHKLEKNSPVDPNRSNGESNE